MEKKKWQKWLLKLFLVLLVLDLVILAGDLIFRFFGPWILLPTIGGAILVIALLAVLAFVGVKLIYHLAEIRRYFVFVIEGTAVPIVGGGQFVKFLMSWEDKVFKWQKDGPQETEEANWEIVDGKAGKSFWWRIFRGARWFGVYPFRQVLKFRAQWTHMHPDGKLATHDEDMIFVMLKKDLYAIRYSLNDKEQQPAEDINGVPTGLTVLFPISVTNPYTVLYRVRKWFAFVTSVGKATARTFVAKYRIKEDLQAMKAGSGIKAVHAERGIDDGVEEGDDLREMLWQEFIATLRNRASAEKEEVVVTDEGIKVWGIMIHKMGLDISDLDPHPDFREAMATAYRAKVSMEKQIIDADAKLAVSERSAKQKAQESAGMHVAIRKLLVEQDKIEPEKAEEMAESYVRYWKGLEEGKYTVLDIKGEGNTEVAIAKIFATIEMAKKALDPTAGSTKVEPKQKKVVRESTGKKGGVSLEEEEEE